MVGWLINFSGIAYNHQPVLVDSYARCYISAVSYPPTYSELASQNETHKKESGIYLDLRVCVRWPQKATWNQQKPTTNGRRVIRQKSRYNWWLCPTINIVGWLWPTISNYQLINWLYQRFMFQESTLAVVLVSPGPTNGWMLLICLTLPQALMFACTMPWSLTTISHV